jgi:hypothetical protein
MLRSDLLGQLRDPIQRLLEPRRSIGRVVGIRQIQSSDRCLRA